MPGRHALISGSLDAENLGDEALVDAFLAAHRADYAGCTLLSARPDRFAHLGLEVLRPPWLALGPRVWRGFLDRRLQRWRMRLRAPRARVDFVWLGGLLGYAGHNRYRIAELRWARRVSSRLVYYFGDAGDVLASADNARALVRAMDRAAPWVAVRSRAAADVLRGLGLRAPIRLGVDPVLFARAGEGLPTERRAPPDDTLALVPARAADVAALTETWLAAARAGVAAGLRVAWLSFCDPEDLELCRALAARLARDLPTASQEVVPGAAAPARLRASRLCVASRLHGCIFALCDGVPTLAAPYGAKVRRLFELLGREGSLLEDASAATPALARALREGTGAGGTPSGAFAAALDAHRAACPELSATLRGT